MSATAAAIPKLTEAEQVAAIRARWADGEPVPDVLEVLEVCAYLRCSRNALLELMHREEEPIPYRKIGRVYGVRFLRRAVDAWLTGADNVPMQLRMVG